jgi:hypothetical protein
MGVATPGVKRLLEDMEAIFGDDITGLEGEDRDDVTFESWLADMLSWGRLYRNRQGRRVSAQ